MCNSISRQNIKRANKSLIKHRSRSFSINGGQAQIRCHTKFGPGILIVPTQKIIDAAASVMRNRI